MVILASACAGAVQVGRIAIEQRLLAVLLSLALFLMLFAASRPRWGVREEIVFKRGRDLVIALDVSRSMLAEDARPTRLARAKQYIDKLPKESRVTIIPLCGSWHGSSPDPYNKEDAQQALDKIEKKRFSVSSPQDQAD